MKTKITVLLLIMASFLFAVNGARAQSTTGFNTYNSAYYLGWSSSNDLPFKLNGATFMTLKTTGYFGIGTTTPLGTLDVLGANNAASWAYIRGNTAGTKPSTSFNGGGLGIGWNYTNAQGEVDFVSNGSDLGGVSGFRFQKWDGSSTLTDLVTIQGGGNVGIGTTSPSTQLHTTGGVRFQNYSSGFLTVDGSGNLGVNTGGSSLFTAGTGLSWSSATLNSVWTASGSNIFNNNSGNVGLGTSSPSYILDILQSQNAASRASITNSFNGTASQVLFQAVNDATNSLQLGITSSGYTPSGLVSANMGFVQTNSGSLLLRTYGTNDMIFATNNANAMIIKSGGNVGIGNTAPSYKLDVTGDVRATGVLFANNTASATNGLDINGNGHSSTNTWTSDQMFKTNIDSIHNILAVIKQLKPKTYYFDTTNVYGLNFPSKKQYGFVAQDLQQVLPELLSTETKSADVDTLGNIVHPAVTYRGVYYLELIAILTKGIQEQQQKIDSLTTKTTNQDSANASLQNQVNQLKTKTNNQDTVNASLQNQLNQLLTVITNCCNRSQSLIDNGNNGNTKSMNIGAVPQGETTQMDVELNDAQTIVLQQNLPNPFAERTSINYYLPDNTGKTQILFYNAQGKLIQSADIIQKGKGTLNVFASDLSNGIYTYTLVVDGKVIETKKMIKQ